MNKTKLAILEALTDWQTDEDLADLLEDPVYTVTTLTGGGQYLIRPIAEPFVLSHARNTVPRSTVEPIPTNTTRGPGYLVDAKARPFMLGQQSAGAPRSTDEPAPTVAAAGAISLVNASIIEYYGGEVRAKDVEAPLSTVTQRIKHALVYPSLVQYNGQSLARDIDEPLATILTCNKQALVNPVLVEYYGNGTAANVDNPLPTVTTKDRHGLATPSLVEVNHADGDRVRSIEEPLGTLTSKRGTALVNPEAQPCIVPNFGEAEGQHPRAHSIEQPMPTVTSRGAGNLVSPVLEQVEQGEIDPRRLVFVDGVPYLLDIRFRMLQNPELARAMGFEDDDDSYEFVGTVADITKQIGNAVPVHMASALVSAVLAKESVEE